MKKELLEFGFTDEVWMKKSYLDDNGYQFTLSIEPKSGWSCLEQTNTQGFSAYQISTMADIDEDTKFIMQDSQIALLPFRNIHDVYKFWNLLTHQENVI